MSVKTGANAIEVEIRQDQGSTVACGVACHDVLIYQNITIHMQLSEPSCDGAPCDAMRALSFDERRRTRTYVPSVDTL